MTQLQGTQKTDNRTDSRNGDSRKKQLIQPVEWENVAYRAIMPSSCPLTNNRGKESSPIRICIKTFF